MRASLFHALVVGALAGFLGCTSFTFVMGNPGGEGGRSTTTSAGGAASSNHGTSVSGSAPGGGGTGGVVDPCVGSMAQAEMEPNDTIEEASCLPYGQVLSANIGGDKDVDYYKLMGMKGDAVVLDYGLDFAQVAILGPSQQVIVDNDFDYGQPTMNHRMVTILPEDGTYWVRIEDAWSSSVLPYVLEVKRLDEGSPTYAFEAAGTVTDTNNGSPGSNNVAVKYEKDPVYGGYMISTVYGVFDDQSDVDVFELSIPANAASEPAVASFYPWPPGVHGNGSEVGAGRISIIDGIDLSTVAALDLSAGVQRISGRGPRIQAPLALAKTYYLQVERTAPGPLGRDFYFIDHDTTSAYDWEHIESQSPFNGQPTTAEDLGQGSTFSYNDILGNLEPALTDIDYFKIGIPTNAQTFDIGCWASRIGSGIQGIHVDVYGESNTQTPAFSADETEYAKTMSLSLLGSDTTLLFRVSAIGQDPSVTGTYYWCNYTFD